MRQSGLQYKPARRCRGTQSHSRLQTPCRCTASRPDSFPPRRGWYEHRYCSLDGDWTVPRCPRSRAGSRTVHPGPGTSHVHPLTKQIITHICHTCMRPSPPLRRLVVDGHGRVRGEQVKQRSTALKNFSNVLTVLIQYHQKYFSVHSILLQHDYKRVVFWYQHWNSFSPVSHCLFCWSTLSTCLWNNLTQSHFLATSNASKCSYFHQKCWKN